MQYSNVACHKSYCGAGIGKSTLLGLISGQLEPTKGTITRNPKVRMAVFSQHHVDGLDLALTPLAYMLASFANTKEQEHRCSFQPRGIRQRPTNIVLFPLNMRQLSTFRHILRRKRYWGGVVQLVEGMLAPC